jgi:transcriptional regulator with XRE-family HTH domain
MNITEKIQTLRKQKGWPVTRLAQETGIPTVSLRVMLSRTNPNNYTIKNLVKIAEALGVTVSYLTLDDNDSKNIAPAFPSVDQLKETISKAIDNFFGNNTPEPEQNESMSELAKFSALNEDFED